MAALARITPVKLGTREYAAVKSEMMSQPRRASLYTSANTKCYVAEVLAVSALGAGGAPVWLHLHDDNRERGTATAAGSHVVPTATGLTFQGGSEVVRRCARGAL